jgi:amyloid beta precursor protein binding protein 1
LQTLYKQQADDEKRIFKSFIGQELAVDEEAVDEFVRNAHGLRLLRGKQFGSLDTDKDALGEHCIPFRM